jgi:hypothetical protein
MQAQTPASPHGAGRMKSSVQSTVGLVTGRGVDAPPAQPNLKPQIAALLHQVLQICCRLVATAHQSRHPPTQWVSHFWDYAGNASLDRGVDGDGLRHRGSSGARPAAEDRHLPAGLLHLGWLLRALQPAWHPRSHPEERLDMPPGLVHERQLLRQEPLIGLSGSDRQPAIRLPTARMTDSRLSSSLVQLP